MPRKGQPPIDEVSVTINASRFSLSVKQHGAAGKEYLCAYLKVGSTEISKSKLPSPVDERIPAIFAAWPGLCEEDITTAFRAKIVTRARMPRFVPFPDVQSAAPICSSDLHLVLPQT